MSIFFLDIDFSYMSIYFSSPSVFFSFTNSVVVIIRTSC